MSFQGMSWLGTAGLEDLLEVGDLTVEPTPQSLEPLDDLAVTESGKPSQERDN